jgi:5-epi-alpha-selinene synthase
MQHWRLVRSPAAQQRFLTAQYWVLIAYAYPTAPFTDLALANDWNCWGFLLDDIDDDSALARKPEALQGMFADILRVLQGDTSAMHGGPLIDGLRDVWGRLTALTTLEWRRRFQATLGAGLAAYHWEAANRAGKIIPDRATYLAQRRQTGGWLTDAALVDVVERFTVPDDFLRHPIIAQLLEAANNAICWANDLYSLEKEIARGDVHNLVLVLQHEEGCALPDAIARVAALHDDEVRRFEALAQAVPRFGDERDRMATAYIRFCQNFMSGNIAWSRQSGRYRAVAASAPGTPPAYLESIVQTRRRHWFSRIFRRS